MSVGTVNDASLCGSIQSDYKINPVVFWQVDEQNFDKDAPDSSAEVHTIIGSDTKEIVEKVLALLPNPQLLDNDSFRVSIVVLFNCLFYSIFNIFYNFLK